MDSEPILAVLYSASDWKFRQPHMKVEHRQAYEEFCTLAKEEFGIQMMRMSAQWFAGNAFQRAWLFDGTLWKKIRKPIRPDVILDKTVFRYEDIPLKIRMSQLFTMVNAWDLDLLASDKLFTYTLFSDFAPPTAVVHSHEDLKRALVEIPGNELILKPRLGSGGKGIQVLSRTEAARVDVSEPMLIQPLMDTSKGIPGVYNGIHDLRIVFANEKPIMQYIRTPAPGTKLCNISLGGGVQFIEYTDIPDTLHPVLEQVLAGLRLFKNKMFSVDFFFVDGRPYLIELNTKPITYFPTQHVEHQQKLHKLLLEFIAPFIL